MVSGTGEQRFEKAYRIIDKFVVEDGAEVGNADGAVFDGFWW